MSRCDVSSPAASTCGADLLECRASRARPGLPASSGHHGASASRPLHPDYNSTFHSTGREKHVHNRTINRRVATSSSPPPPRAPPPSSGAPTILTAMQNARNPTCSGPAGTRTRSSPTGRKLPDNKKCGNTPHGPARPRTAGSSSTTPRRPATLHRLRRRRKIHHVVGRRLQKGGAHGMELRKEGNEEFLYFATTGSTECSRRTSRARRSSSSSYPKEAMNAKGEPCYTATRSKPTNIVPTLHRVRARRDKGDFYVADGYGSNYVHRYNIDGKYIRTFGGTGNGDGQLKCPHGIWCDTRDAGQPARSSSPTAPTSASSGSRSTASTSSRSSDELRHPCHFDQRGRRHAHPRPARPRHDLRQGQQAGHAPRRQPRPGRSAASTA